MKLRDAAPAVGVFVVALAWLLLLRPYGFQLEDEGTLLFWFDRVMRGQQPYTDFHTGYTPGFFSFGAAVFSVFGPSATALRGVLAVLNATTAAMLTEVTRRIAGRWLAPIPALVWLAFVPVYVGEFAAFNVPYPTWPVTIAWMVLALALVSWVERPRRRLLVAAGLAAAWAVWFKPNSGAFAMAAATWVIAAASSRRSALDRAAAAAASAFMLLGVCYTFEFRFFSVDAIVHLVPAFAIAALCTFSMKARLGDRGGSGTTTCLAILASAFALPTLVWSLPLISRLGFSRFLFEAFLVGADYQSLYYKPHPSPEPYAIVVVAALLGLAAGGALVQRRRLRPVPLLAAMAATGVVVKLALLRSGVAPEGVLRSVVAQLENASFWLAATTSYASVAWLALVPSRELYRWSRARALVATAPVAVAMYMQMFPRSDFMHEVTAVPLTAAVACALLDRMVRWWAAGEWPESWNGARLVRGSVVASAAGILLLAFGDKAAGPLAAWADRAPKTALPARLDVHVEAAAGDELEAFASTVAYLREHTEDSEELWSFPATSGVLFAAGRRNASPHDYWHPGRPNHEEEQRVLGLLRAKTPRFLVTVGKGWSFFAESPLWFADLRSFAVERYRLVARFGRYDVLARRDLELPAVVAADALAREVPRGAVSARDQVVEPNLERRRQAAWRWMDAMTPAEAAAAALPADSRDALLLLRGLRDGGDMRGAAWAILGYESTDPRVRAEAADAMVALAAELRSRRARLANDFDAAAWSAYVAPWRARAEALGAVEGLGPFVEAVRDLSAAGDGSRGAVDLRTGFRAS